MRAVELALSQLESASRYRTGFQFVFLEYSSAAWNDGWVATGVAVPTETFSNTIVPNFE